MRDLVVMTISLLLLSAGMPSAAYGEPSISPMNGVPQCLPLDPDIRGSYRGSCRNGLPDGHGEARGRDTYVGNFRAGEPDGIGTYTWGPGTKWTGDSYVGDFKDRERTGRGLYKSSSGRVYEGYLLNGNYEGFGELQIPRREMTENVGGVGKWYGDTWVGKGLFIDNSLALECESAEECLSSIAATLKQAVAIQPVAPAGPDRAALKANCEGQRAICRASCASVVDPQHPNSTTKRSTCESRCSNETACWRY